MARKMYLGRMAEIQVVTVCQVYKLKYNSALQNGKLLKKTQFYSNE